MNLSNLSLQQKITNLLVVYFIVAFVAIASTLFVSWKLEGGAAAINDAGSERMRSYQVGLLLAHYINEPSQKVYDEIGLVIADFEQTLVALATGDPDRPLSLPKNKTIRHALQQIDTIWYEQNKPVIISILNEEDHDKAWQLLNRYQVKLDVMVTDIDNLVMMIENSQSRAAQLLRNFQTGLVSLAFIGTILLIALFMRMVVSPIRRLKQGLDHMGQGDFSIRLPVNSDDELGEVATGFNRMASQLQEIYATLEDRIKTKTKSIELKSRELSALYDAATFLNSSTATETLCDGVLDKMVILFGAQAGVIRLLDHKKQAMPIVACYGVSEDFINQEQQLKCGDCLCGKTSKGAEAASYNINQIEEELISEQVCKREGFEGIVSVPIKARQGVIGVFNLFFQYPRILPKSELKLLETVSQHLGSAIENQHFVAREKEMAISEERNLLAQELHDSIAQSLAFLNIQAQLLQDSLRKGHLNKIDSTLAQIREGIQESYDDVRELLVHFRTRIKHEDIDIAIADALDKFEGQTGIKTHYDFIGQPITLEPEIILQFLHILHECLSNIRKHSQATDVDIQLEHGHDYQLIIHDNGIGFDHHKDAGETHVGLRIMKERTHRIGGQLTIDSSPEDGTTICLTLPATINLNTDTI